MKQRFFLLLALPLLIVASCKKDAEKSTALSAIPVRSAFVVRVNNLNKLALDLEASVPAQAIKKSIVFSDLNEFVELLDKYRQDKDNQIKAFGGFDQFGAGKFGWIWTMDEEELPFISKAVLSANGEVAARSYGQSEIVHFVNNELDFYFAHQSGLLMLSKQENLVESALKQLESKINLGRDAQFLHTLKTTSAKDPANVFIQWHSLPDWLASKLTDKPEWPANLSTWSALELDINENDINLTGISLVPDSASVYMGLFAGTGTGNCRFTNLIPENTALAISQTCGNTSTWQKNLGEFLGKKNRQKKRLGQLKDADIDVDKWMELTNEEIGIFYSEGSAPTIESKNGFIRIEDAESFIPLLNKIGGEFYEEYRGKNVGQLKSRFALPLIYGRIFSNMAEPYWFIHDEWVIFSNSLSGTKAIINNLLSSKTLANSTGFEQVESYLDDHANIAMVIKNPEWLELAQKELNETLLPNFKKTKELLKPINWVVANISQKNEAAYSELVLIHQTKETPSAKQYWGLDLDKPAITTPQLVKNHRNGENEVVVQDEAFNLYLINATGNVLWKHPLDGPILGEITQVDLYKNNKLQLAFNTAQRFYILDRNGNNVGAFPVVLKKHATAPAAILDYDKTRNYRFVIPCGEQLVNYNKDAQEVNGWNHKKAKADIILQPKHAVIGSRDFIYTVDAKGNVYLLNRRGEVREKIKSTMPKLASEMYLVADKNVGGKLSALSTSGYTLSLFINDQLDSIQPYGDKPKYMFVQGKTQLLASENEVYKRDETSNFDIDLEYEIVKEPRLYRVGNQSFIAVTTEKNEVWIYDENGEILPGMPLYGSGIAVIGKTNGKSIHAIVTTKEGTLLDYKLMQ